MRTRLAASALMVVGVIGLAGCGSGASIGGAPTGPTTPPAGTLAGTAWTLTSYAGPGGGPVAAVAEVTASLAFEVHGVLVASTGCNNLRGTYTTSGEALSIVPGPTTMMACVSAALTAQETALFRLFPEVAGYSRSSDRLILTGTGGATLLTYAAGLSGLTGTSWIATGVNNGRGGVESTSATEDLTASFGADGAFTGFGGCNTLSGSYRVTATRGLTVADLVSTQKACAAEVDALEAQYTAALGRVAQYAIFGDTLTVRNAAGETQATYRLAG